MKLVPNESSLTLPPELLTRLAEMNQEILAAKINALSTIAEAKANLLQNVEQLKSKQQLLQSKAEELQNAVAALNEAKAQATQNIAAIESSEVITGQNSVDNVTPVVEGIADDKDVAVKNVVKPDQ